MDDMKSVLVIVPTDRKFKISFNCEDNKSDLECIRKKLIDICGKDFALRQIFDNSEKHFIFKKYDDLFKCEIEVTDTDVIEHGNVLYATILSPPPTDITLPLNNLAVLQKSQKSGDTDVVCFLDKNHSLNSEANKSHRTLEPPSSNRPPNLAFFVVQFLDTKEADVVPETWLNNDITMCSYPNYASAIKLAEAVKTAEEVGQGWKVRPVKFLKASETYEIAVKNLLELKVVIISQAKSRANTIIKRSLVEVFNSDQDEDVSGNMDCSSISEFIKSEYSCSQEEDSDKAFDDNTLPRLDISSSSQISNAQIHFPSQFTRNSQSSLNISREKSEMYDEDFKHKVMKYLLEINKKVQVNTVLMNRLIEQGDNTAINGLNPDTIHPPPFQLPFSRFEDIEAFNAYLENVDNFNSCVAYFSIFSGDTWQKTVKMLLNEMIGKETAVAYNWKGRGYKRPFKEMKRICELIYRATKNNPRCRDVTLIEVLNHIKYWLRFFPSNLTRNERRKPETLGAKQ